MNVMGLPLLGTLKMKALTSLCVEPTVQRYQLLKKDTTTDSVYFVVVIYVVHGRSPHLNALSGALNGMASIDGVDNQ